MLIRYFVVVVCALAVTAGLLLFMNEAANRLALKDPVRLFRITDFIAAPDRGRQRPAPPPKPAQRPDTPELRYEAPVNAPLRLDIPESESSTERGPALDGRG